MMEVWESDVLLPSQFYELHRTRRALVPMARLMFAVLSDAIECFMRFGGGALANRHDRHPHRARRRAFEAEIWIQSNDDGPFAFETVCGVLDIEPEVLRRGLFAWRQRVAEGIPTRMPRLERSRGGDRPLRLAAKRKRRRARTMA